MEEQTSYIFRKFKDFRNEILYCLFVSAVLMLLITRSSPLYPYNNWDDANSYFSMGKSMFHGTMIYRDIFDQKGPYLYFLYGLCSLISRKTFFGVFLMEILLGAADLFGFYAILRLYGIRTQTANILLPLGMAVTFASKSFYWGGSAEEICLPFLIWALYLTLRCLRRNKAGALFPLRTVFAVGLLCGVVAAIKFTLLGYYFAFMLLVMFSSFRHGRTSDADPWFIYFLKACGVFLLGMFVPVVPWLIYFGINGALDDWYHVYIYTNVFIYSTFGAANKGESLYDKVYGMAKILYWLILDNIQYYVLIIPGLLYALLRKGSGFLERIAPILMFGFLFLGIYIGGSSLPYYAFPLTVFAVFGLLAAGRVIDWATGRMFGRLSSSADSAESVESTSNSNLNRQQSLKPWMSGRTAAICISLAASLALIYVFSLNSYYLRYRKGDVFLYHFAKDIEAVRVQRLAGGSKSSEDYDESGRPAEIRESNTSFSGQPAALTLLNYNCLDCGLYTAADIYPTCYWFQTQTIPLDDVFSEQHRYIREGLTDFVVVRDDYPEFIFEQYDLMHTFPQNMGGTVHTYYLFMHK